ncbi:MAG: VOC family protein [Chromatiales bacterium]|nr:VOC family protein [Chromatiales bacterium]
MQRKLDTIHHTAIQVQDIAKAVSFYTKHFACEIEYQDESWAMLKFANASLALILPKQHPYHFAIVADDLSSYGQAVLHRDGTRSVYIQDEDGNYTEIIKLADDETTQ